MFVSVLTLGLILRRLGLKVKMFPHRECLCARFSGTKLSGMFGNGTISKLFLKNCESLLGLAKQSTKTKYELDQTGI